LVLLVAFGCYLLILLIVGVASFRSCPEDAKALQQVRCTAPPGQPCSTSSAFELTMPCLCGLLQDILRAREDLRARGFHFSTS
jgi:hypothetical protein